MDDLKRGDPVRVNDEHGEQVNRGVVTSVPKGDNRYYGVIR